ncbi:MAG: hypothetical protein OXE57_11940 [Alphaproteobacteria bacterium]|nr:hypothetical protein [Alphaproteobacteria bacterium]
MMAGDGLGPPGYGAANRIVTREMADRALERLQAKLAGCDPEDDPAERDKRCRFLDWIHGRGPEPDDL